MDIHLMRLMEKKINTLRATIETKDAEIAAAEARVKEMEGDLNRLIRHRDGEGGDSGFFQFFDRLVDEDTARTTGRIAALESELAEERECCTKSQEILSERITNLERELAEAKDQIETIRGNNCYEIRSRIGSALGVRAGDSILTGDLVNMIAEAKQDTARLDWLESCDMVKAWMSLRGVFPVVSLCEHEDIRAVIDDARGGTG